MWTSVTGSSTAKMNHLRQLERNQRHQNRVTRSISGPNKKITDSVKDGPFSNQTGNKSNAKSGSKMKDTSKKAPRRKYYRPSNDTKTFQINNKGHLQCPTRPQTHSQAQRQRQICQAAGKHQSTMNQGQCQGKTMEDLKKLYPNSFDRLGSLKGAYNIKIDPSVKPADACQEEGANRVQRSNRQGNWIT